MPLTPEPAATLPDEVKTLLARMTAALPPNMRTLPWLSVDWKAIPQPFTNW